MVKLLGIIGAVVIFGGLIFDLIYNKLPKKTRLKASDTLYSAIYNT